MTPGLVAALTKGRVVLGFFITAQVVYLVMVLVTLPHLRGLAGGMDPFDMLPAGYDAEYALNFIGAIGPEGITFYLTRQIPFDLIYPGLFAVTYAIVWLWLLAKAGSVPKMFKAFAFLPIFAGLSDYVENGFIVTMLIKFPKLSESLVTMASVSSITKSAATTLYFMALLGLAVFVGIYKFKGGNH